VELALRHLAEDGRLIAALTVGLRIMRSFASSALVKLRCVSERSSVHGPAISIPAQMREKSQMPVPVNVTAFRLAKASIFSAKSGSAPCGK
jgi:hypothetical protein